MFKIVVVGTIALFASAKYHPVNQDIVNEIKAKATTWVPYEAHENPLANRPIEDLINVLGTRFDPMATF